MCNTKTDKRRQSAVKLNSGSAAPTPIPKARVETHWKHREWLPGEANACMWVYRLKPLDTAQNSHNIPTTNTKTTTTIITTSRQYGNCQKLIRSMFFLQVTIGMLIWQNLGGNWAALAKPQSCILCDKDDLKIQQAAHATDSYEEFLFEHQVTRQDAISALRALNESFYRGFNPENSCKSLTCTKKIMKYCSGPQFINDHCWCEFGHTREGLPFVPHICYVGEKEYKASVGSCFFYEEVKECCCGPALATEWRHISSAPTQHLRNLRFLLSMALLLLFVAGHHLKAGLSIPIKA